MSIVIALIVVFSIAGLIIKFYPKPIKPTLAEGEILIPELEPVKPVVEPIPEIIIEPLVEAPKMDTKPKKKTPKHKKKPIDA